VTALTLPIQPQPLPNGLLGSHPLMVELRDAIRRAAASSAPVVIWGPTGAGKEVAARALHAQSCARGAEFCPVNLAAVPEALIEGELFGVRRGAYTGATTDRAGLVEAAANGTLFLDEAGDLPPAIQTKLLRVLESGELKRVGATRGMTVQFRLVAATQVEPAALRSGGRWRDDLYYRLAGVVLRVPALHERRSDIPEIARAYCVGRGLQMPEQAAISVLESYEWPGNVRELQHTLLRAAFLADHGVIGRDHVEAAIRGAPQSGQANRPVRLCTLLEAQRAHVEAVLSACGGDTARAAAILNISRRHMYRFLRPWTPASTRH